MSGNGHPTETISSWVDQKFQPIMKSLSSYLRDSTHLIEILRSTKINIYHKMYSFDVVSLYTNIPHEDGIKAIHNRAKEIYPETEVKIIAELAGIVLKNNTFQFNNNWYIQKQGTAMGTKMAPAYANIFMAEIEEEILEEFPHIHLWKRFIDDIILIIDTR